MTLFDDETTRRADKKHKFDDNFTRAMQKAFMEDLRGFLKRKSRKLLPFEEVKDKLEIWFARDLGIQNVLIDSIVGSEGRYHAFTRSFLPLQEDQLVPLLVILHSCSKMFSCLQISVKY